MRIYFNLVDLVHNLRDDLIFRFPKCDQVYAYFETDVDGGPVRIVVSDEED